METNPGDNLATFDEQGSPKTRISDAQSARSILDIHLREDLPSSERRAEIQGVIDGNAPFTRKELEDAGREDAINVNWGHAESEIETARLPYFNMLTDVPTFARIYTGYGKNANQQDKWGRIISEEFHTLLKGDSNFFLTHLLIQNNLVTHGPACGYFRDALDWRTFSIKPENLIVPRDASIKWNSWEYCFLLDSYKADELYRYISNPKAAERGGWNIEEVALSLKNARVEDQDKDHTWEWYQRQIKNNGMWTSVAKSKVIRIAHLYVREFSGKISHYIFDRDTANDWLCVKFERYNDFKNAFTIFLSDIGNGDFHSVRGLGQKVYKYAEAINRVNNALLEGVIVDSAKMVQASSAGDVKRMESIQLGPFRILPAGIKPFSMPVSNLAEALQVTQYFQSQEARQNASYTPTLGVTDRKMSKQETENRMMEKAKLTSTRAEFYMLSLDLHYEEVYRRASNPNLLPEDPGGNEALKFQARCMSRGVPKAALRSNIAVEATRSMGQGSPAARSSAMQAIGQFIPMLPEKKKLAVMRDSIAAIGGERFASIYGPDDQEEELVGADASIASLENNAFMTGGQTLIDPNQNHFIHCTIHLKFFASVVDEVKKHQMDPRQAEKCLNTGGPHVLTHLNYLKEDPTRKEQFNTLNRQMADLMKIADQIAKMAEELQQSEEQQGQQGQNAGPQTTQIQNRMQIDQAKAQNDMSIKMAKAKQQMQLKDLTVAQRLHLTNTSFSQKQQQQHYASMEESPDEA